MKYFHGVLLAIFATFNALMLYLFQLHLPFGFDPLVASFTHWDRFEGIEVALTLALLVTLGGMVWVKRAREEVKNQVTYMKWHHPHPAATVFFTSRKQPFETNAVLAAFPAVKDAAFAPAMQQQVWDSLYAKHAKDTLIASTRLYWALMRDLFLLSTVFMSGFLGVWLLNLGTPLAFALPYVFVFGAQFLFLMISARGGGFRLADNVVAAELGIGAGESGVKEEKKGKRRF